MRGTENCVYETPCGWCSKWDKKCDKKAPERGQRIKCNPIDDARSPVSWEKNQVKMQVIWNGKYSKAEAM